MHSKPGRPSCYMGLSALEDFLISAYDIIKETAPEKYRGSENFF